MSSIDTHALGHGLLAELGGEAVAAHVGAHELADFHPQGGQHSRILVLRIKIRDGSGMGWIWFVGSLARCLHSVSLSDYLTPI